VTRRECLAALAAPALVASESSPVENDPLRPSYHFLPPRNWMNDPNGLIYHKGLYHLFYQYNPDGAYWGNMHWGHATSPDMVHWKHLPIALAPVPGGPDKDGVFSGCCRMHNGVPTIFYTGVSPETQNIILANDDLTRFRRFAGNPVIAHPPEGLEVTAFRDPNVWQEGEDWMMAIGSGRKGGNGMVLLYRSRDLAHWEYLHPLAEAARAEDGVIWECPNFLALRPVSVLIVSADHPIRKPFYWTGNYENRRFEARKMGAIDDGGYCYAPQVFLDGRGRQILFGWVPEGRTVAAQKAAGWAGAQSIPRILEVSPGGELLMRPVPEFEMLRGAAISDPAKLKGDSYEIEAEFAASRSSGLAIRVSPDGRLRTVVRFDAQTGRLSIDRTHSSDNKDNEQDVRDAALSLSPAEPLRLRVFLDRSIIEVFANERVVMTSRIYPPAECTGFDVLNPALLRRFCAWPMRPAV
jgi:beta-fructofuranosidase